MKKVFYLLLLLTLPANAALTPDFLNASTLLDGSNIFTHGQSFFNSDGVDYDTNPQRTYLQNYLFTETHSHVGGESAWLWDNRQSNDVGNLTVGVSFDKVVTETTMDVRWGADFITLLSDSNVVADIPEYHSPNWGFGDWSYRSVSAAVFNYDFNFDADTPFMIDALLNDNALVLVRHIDSNTILFDSRTLLDDSYVSFETVFDAGATYRVTANASSYVDVVSHRLNASVEGDLIAAMYWGDRVTEVINPVPTNISTIPEPSSMFVLFGSLALWRRR